MTLIKSLLLGSAAGLVAVASAQAADLPTRKGPVAAEYVRVCSITVAGAPVVGFVLPGSDTCLKISGYITGQIEGGNLKTGYTTTVAHPFGGWRDRRQCGHAGDHGHVHPRFLRLLDPLQPDPRRGLQHGLRPVGLARRVSVQPLRRLR